MATHSSILAREIPWAEEVASYSLRVGKRVGHDLTTKQQQHIDYRVSCMTLCLFILGNGTTDWFKIGKGVHQGFILLPCLFKLYAEYIMLNAGLDEAQAGIKIAGRNINNLRHVGDTILMAESEEKLKNLLMKVKEESLKAGLKLNIQKTKIMASGPITSWQIDGEIVETVRVLLWAPKSLQMVTANMKLKGTYSLEGKL